MTECSETHRDSGSTGVRRVSLPHVCHVKENGHQSSGRKPLTILVYGRDAEIRTRDLTHPKRARYQAAPRPVKRFKYVWKSLIVKWCHHSPLLLFRFVVGRKYHRRVARTLSAQERIKPTHFGLPVISWRKPGSLSQAWRVVLLAQWRVVAARCDPQQS